MGDAGNRRAIRLAVQEKRNIPSLPGGMTQQGWTGQMHTRLGDKEHGRYPLIRERRLLIIMREDAGVAQW